MAEPLSIAASVVGIIGPALHGTRLLLQDLQELKDVSKNVKRLVEDVHSVDTALELLKGIEEREWDLLGVDVAKESKTTISSSTYSFVRSSHLTEEVKNTISVRQNEVKGAITTADKQLIVLENKVEEMNISDDDEEVATTAEGRTNRLRQLEEELKGVKASQKLLSELLLKSQEEAIAKAAGSQSGSTTVTFGAQNSGFQAGIINGGVSRTSFGGK